MHEVVRAFYCEILHMTRTYSCAHGANMLSSAKKQQRQTWKWLETCAVACYGKSVPCTMAKQATVALPSATRNSVLPNAVKSSVSSQEGTGLGPRTSFLGQAGPTTAYEATGMASDGALAAMLLSVSTIETVLTKLSAKST